MERKLYLNRGAAGQEKSSYGKILLWAAVGLVILMLVATRLTGIKGGKNGSSRSSQEKSGAVVREIPRGAGGETEGAQQVVPLPPEPVEVADSRVGPLPGMQPVSESEVKPAAPASEKSLEPGGIPAEGVAGKSVPGSKEQLGAITSSNGAATQAFKALDGVAPPPPAPASGKAAAPPTAKTAPSQTSSAQTAARTSPKTVAGQPGAKPKDGTATPAVPKASTEAVKPKTGGAELYAVQVGSYQEKKHADELQQKLTKKGYSVSIRTKPDPKGGGGQLYVVQLDPVSDKGKAHTLVAQIQNEEKVKPFITKVQPGE